MTNLQFEVEKKLAECQIPYLKQDIISAKILKKLIVTENTIEMKLVLGFPFNGFKEELINLINQQLVSFNKKISIDFSANIETHVGQRNIKASHNIRNIIAIASGKGGVGKSTVAVNLALSLAFDGARVGLLDADIYGPSHPIMLGISEKPKIDGKKIYPIEKFGLQSMSIGYLVAENAAMVWRGPMISMALQQLFNDTQWESLDYLIIDLPPGTGDIALTLSQKIPVSGAVIVTTPQDLALADVRRACEMFQKVNVPVLGIIENMSHFICSNCQQESAIFGLGGGEKIAKEFNLELVAQLPLSTDFSKDDGHPMIATNPHSKISQLFHDAARRATAKLSLQPKDYSGKFPAIIVE